MSPQLHPCRGGPQRRNALPWHIPAAPGMSITLGSKYNSLNILNVLNITTSLYLSSLCLHLLFNWTGPPEENHCHHCAWVGRWHGMEGSPWTCCGYVWFPDFLSLKTKTLQQQWLCVVYDFLTETPVLFQDDSATLLNLMRPSLTPIFSLSTSCLLGMSGPCKMTGTLHV